MFIRLHLDSMCDLLRTEVQHVSFISLFVEFTVSRRSPIPCPGISAETPGTDVVLGHGIERHRRRPQDTTGRVRQRNLARYSLLCRNGSFSTINTVLD